jgi:hypothetical protein
MKKRKEKGFKNKENNGTRKKLVSLNSYSENNLAKLQIGLNKCKLNKNKNYKDNYKHTKLKN